MSAAIVINEEETLAFPRFSTSDEANAAHKRIAGCVQDALGIGEFLARQKEELGHGNYLSWFRANIEFDERTGQRYAKLYANRDRIKYDTVSHLDLTEAYRIAGVLKEPKSKEPVVDATFEVVPADPYTVESLSLERGLDGQMFNVSGSARNPKYALLRDGTEEPKSWTPPQSSEETAEVLKSATQPETYSADDDPYLINDDYDRHRERLDRVDGQVAQIVSDMVERLRKEIATRDYWLAIDALINHDYHFAAFRTVLGELKAFEQARDNVMKEQREQEKKVRRKEKREAAKLGAAQ